MIFKEVTLICKTEPININVTDEELEKMKVNGVDITNPDEVLLCKLEANKESGFTIRDFEYENVEGLKHE